MSGDSEHRRKSSYPPLVGDLIPSGEDSKRGPTSKERLRTGEVLQGISGSPGIAIGRVLVVGPLRHGYPRRAAIDAEIEISRFRRAVQRAQKDLRAVAERAPESTAHSVLEAYVLMAQDPTLDSEVVLRIRRDQKGAEWAVALAVESIAEKLGMAKDAYLRERRHDIEFVGEHILRAFVESSGGHQALPAGPIVMVARDLSPADTAAMAGTPIVGLATEGGTRTSHTAITARALKVPAVVGVADLLGSVQNGQMVILDGLRGTIVVGPSEREIEEAERRLERYLMRANELRESRGRPSVTTDGVSVSLRANVELPEEATQAHDEGVDGVGLYRTEYLYIGQPRPPSEEHQLDVFKSVLKEMQGRPVTLRTFDLGGDKFTSSFMLPHELNPMLGLRAVRLALSRPEVFLEHLRAMVRASAFGDIRIMVPMVAGLSELRKVRSLLERAIDEVKESGEPCADTIPLG